MVTGCDNDHRGIRNRPQLLSLVSLIGSHVSMLLNLPAQGEHIEWTSDLEYEVYMK